MAKLSPKLALILLLGKIFLSPANSGSNLTKRSKTAVESDKQNAKCYRLCHEKGMTIFATEMYKISTSIKCLEL